MKKCFNCNLNLPLWLFGTNPKQYQNVSNKGRNYVCKICNYKKWYKNQSTWIWNKDIEKYERIEFNTKWSIIKYLIYN
jgi:hypothetical protein